MSLRATSHAVQRMSQRGFKLSDLELISLIGTEVDDGFLLREDVARETARAWRKLADDAERLAGARIVQAGGAIITAYHANPRTQRRLLSDKPDKFGRKGGRQ